MVQRSRYGKRLTHNLTRQIRPARNFVTAASAFSIKCVHGFHLTHFPVDPEIKRKIDTRIADARNALKDLEVESAQLTKEENAIQADENEFKAKLVIFIPHYIPAWSDG
jgi:hypothetical protein